MNRLDPVTQQTGNTQPCHQIKIALSRFERLTHRLATAAQAVMLIVFLIIGLFIGSATPAYAQVMLPRQVVEYALRLEKLEADFYCRGAEAAQSGGLASAPQVAKDAIISYGEDESQHVRDLSAILTSLGGDPNAVTIPTNPNFNAILKRDPFANPQDFLLAGQYVEDLGVAAYKGQVGNLLAGGAAAKPVLAGALAIHSVEARHAAGVRFLRQALLNADVRPWIRDPREVIYQENRRDVPVPFKSEAFDGYATSDEVLALVTPILSEMATPGTVCRRTAQVETPPVEPQQTQTEVTPEPVRALW